MEQKRKTQKPEDFPPTPIFIARKEVPKFFPGLSPKTLANRASKGDGPPFYKKGRNVFYKVEDLIKDITQTSTPNKP